MKCRNVLVPAILLAVASAAVARPPPADLRGTLQAVNAQYTWGHPDLQGEHDGIRAYAHGHYQAALQAFRQGARYADKLSQLCLGLMYLNGKGVARDPARAWAWFELAAQRHYPGYAQTRDATWGSLSAGQRKRARNVLARLKPVYGDRAAKQRMRSVMEQYRSRVAGSLLGTPGEGEIRLKVDGRSCHCDQLYTDTYWNPVKYFAARDAAYRASVTVGAIRQAQGGTHHRD